MTGNTGTQGPIGPTGLTGNTGTTGAIGATGAAQLYYSYNVQSNNLNGNGTYYMRPDVTGLPTSPQTGTLLPIACAQTKLVVSILGVPPTPYVLTVLRNPTLASPGTATAATCTVSSSVASCSITATPAFGVGDIMQLRLVGTQSFNSWGGALYAAVSCLN